jgi:hypothetical protein
LVGVHIGANKDKASNKAYRSELIQIIVETPSSDMGLLIRILESDEILKKHITCDQKFDTEIQNESDDWLKESGRTKGKMRRVKQLYNEERGRYIAGTDLSGLVDDDTSSMDRGVQNESAIEDKVFRMHARASGYRAEQSNENQLSPSQQSLVAQMQKVIDSLPAVDANCVDQEISPESNSTARQYPSKPTSNKNISQISKGVHWNMSSLVLPKECVRPQLRLKVLSCAPKTTSIQKETRVPQSESLSLESTSASSNTNSQESDIDISQSRQISTNCSTQQSKTSAITAEKILPQDGHGTESAQPTKSSLKKNEPSLDKKSKLGSLTSEQFDSLVQEVRKRSSQQKKNRNRRKDSMKMESIAEQEA